jgi:hypothetical protein
MENQKMKTFLRLFLMSELSTPCLYIDPNTGGMLFQLLAVFLAVFSGILFFFSRQIRSGFARLRRAIKHEPAEEEKPENPEDQN